MELIKNRYALVPYTGFGPEAGERYAALDNTTGELVKDAANVVMTRDSYDASEWLDAMNQWARKH